MNISVYYTWRHPAPTYITCREEDISAFEALGYVQEADAPVHFVKISHPERDLLGLIEIAQHGASFFGNIYPTRESGPALIAGHLGEFVIIAANDVSQPVVAMLEDGRIIGATGARHYWDVLGSVKADLRLERSSTNSAQKAGRAARLRQKWNGLGRRLLRSI